MTRTGKIECTIAILPVSSMGNSIDFYCRHLGFQLDWGGTDAPVSSVSRNGHSIMLMQRSSEFDPAWVWIGVEAEAAFEEFRSGGAQVLQQPRNYSWAYEMKFADPDGNILWVGTEPRKDLPLQDH